MKLEFNPKNEEEVEAAYEALLSLMVKSGKGVIKFYVKEHSTVEDIENYKKYKFY